MTELQKAYYTVLKDMYKSECGMLVGKYDARNGSKEFMHGIAMVMEWIAYRADEELGELFEQLFIENLTKSEEKVLTEK